MSLERELIVRLEVFLRPGFVGTGGENGVGQHRAEGRAATVGDGSVEELTELVDVRSAGQPPVDSRRAIELYRKNTGVDDIRFFGGTLSEGAPGRQRFGVQTGQAPFHGRVAELL